MRHSFAFLGLFFFKIDFLGCCVVLLGRLGRLSGRLVAVLGCFGVPRDVPRMLRGCILSHRGDKNHGFSLGFCIFLWMSFVRRLGANLARLGVILWPFWAVLGSFWGRVGPSWGRLGASCGIFEASWGRPGASWGCLGGVLRASWSVLRASWGRLGAPGVPPGASWVRFGVSWGYLRSSWGRLGSFWGPLGRSWAALGLSGGRFGAVMGTVLGSFCAVVGRFETVCWGRFCGHFGLYFELPLGRLGRRVVWAVVGCFETVRWGCFSGHFWLYFELPLGCSRGVCILDGLDKVTLEIRYRCSCRGWNKMATLMFSSLFLLRSIYFVPHKKCQASFDVGFRNLVTPWIVTAFEHRIFFGKSI